MSLGPEPAVNNKVAALQSDHYSKVSLHKYKDDSSVLSMLRQALC